jgi:hypothetical protein
MERSWRTCQSAVRGQSARRKWSYVVCGVRVLVHAAEECRRGVFANVFGDKMTTARVFVQEV